ncbi:kinase-like domain-containing protein [Gigaspora rosea]|uniref:Kinase-like domain-containing protein n=1 Tax=Gigaspora rosea TaxID=44941 RepID=A0A397W0Q9_9GLOM|nr:kinase-like domain-containing protein [Gigaspora rosea]
MKWEKKLDLLSYIALDLQLIHSYNIIHCDLHSSNIFQNDIYNAYIGDLGFATSINKTLDKKSGGIYGVLPYIAPEVLQGKPFTKATDIYSFGIIMWEISSGRVVTSEYENNDLNLAIEICEGLRPTILEGTTSCYVDLLRRCWNKNPEERPSALEIYETITNWKNDEEILASFSKSDKEIKYFAFDFNVKDESAYGSKFINFTSYQQNRSNFTDEIISNNVTNEIISNRYNVTNEIISNRYNVTNEIISNRYNVTNEIISNNNIDIESIKKVGVTNEVNSNNNIDIELVKREFVAINIEEESLLTEIYINKNM